MAGSGELISTQQYDAWGWNKLQIIGYEADMKRNKRGALKDVKRGDAVTYSFTLNDGIVTRPNILVREVVEDTIIVQLSPKLETFDSFYRSTGHHVDSDPNGIGWITKG